ncbi:Gmc2p [Kluyveromyces lactis]|uniref:KLLA0B04928p n=1 Tax=Kluyveromyces lactis (strain ATCC 8585 / CBS 2359 / DSM 70799 / NBRC 1267 / NRRL Y-1140 / WM37) TaxID=284590 RepID=Q6CWD6_KLULA|nr:uncharacterized protein KLLA0_B04928g [Kluyveromyces lactis]CAH02146.1 KLLA0B04928p [Kluyveromyces lactis]|eukprot:XP_451753.1 uncharacterized protein KLLA0_B04928g [Kluyveromyces lactis]
MPNNLSSLSDTANYIDKASNVDPKTASPCSTNALPLDLHKLAAEWQSDKKKEEVQRQVLQNEFLKSVKEISKSLVKNQNDKSPISQLNWDQMYDVSAELMDQYSKEMEQILAELDEVYKKHFMWQEAAFTIDSHRGATRIANAEMWMKSKEAYLQYTRKELDTSAKVIKTTIEDLSKR